MEIVGRRYDTEAIVRVCFDQSGIQAILSCPGGAHDEELPWIAPGFVDLQVNGFGGCEFSSPDLTIAGVRAVSLAMSPMGVTAYCPTVTTHSRTVLSHALSTIARACETDSDVGPRVIGIHLEGPYISPEDGPRGAHPLIHVRPPDWDEFQLLQEAAGGRIRLLTLSPEYENSATFIRRATDAGVLVAIGHTQANSEQIRAAVDGGARLSTHLGNGAHVQLPRHPNYIWDQLAEDRLTASLIADGHHLPPSVLKSFVRAKGPGGSILVSDITSLAGMPSGLYEESGLGAVEVLQDGRLVVAGQRNLLAGASRPIASGVANLIRHTDCDLAAAVSMASVAPARLVGMPSRGIQVGAPADMVLFRLLKTGENAGVRDVEIVATVQAGRCVHGALSPSVH